MKMDLLTVFVFGRGQAGPSPQIPMFPPAGTASRDVDAPDVVDVAYRAGISSHNYRPHSPHAANSQTNSSCRTCVLL